MSDCTASSPDRALEEKGFCDRWLVFYLSLWSHASSSPDAASLRNDVFATLLPLLCCRMAEGFWNRRLVFFLQSHISSTPDAALLRNDVIATALAAALLPNGCVCVTSSAALVAQAEREGRRSSLTPLGVGSRLRFSCRAGAEYPMSGTAKGTKRAAAEASISNISSLA